MALFNMGKKAYLVLSDGTVYEGYSFGAEGTSFGEVVFTTSSTGYQETLTDPSYYGQIVTQTFPLIGNYGVNDEDFESLKSYVSGYIVREWCSAPSNFRMTGNIDEFLKKYNIVGIHSIDTRSLTRKIREYGVMNGVVTTENPYDNMEKLLEKIKSFRIKDAVKNTSVNAIEHYKAENSRYKTVLIDLVYKFNIRNELIKRGCDVIVVPYNTSAETIKELNPDGIMLSNGAGDPAENTEVIRNISEIVKLGIPIFGICMGHQVTALAHGAKTEKLKYGHRGGNQPVVDVQLGKTFVTSQNHGYAVVSESIDNNIAEISHYNANDKTCEGIRYKNSNTFTVQFHPEAHGGPLDTSYLFDKFIEMMEEK